MFSQSEIKKRPLKMTKYYQKSRVFVLQINKKNILVPKKVAGTIKFSFILTVTIITCVNFPFVQSQQLNTITMWKLFKVTSKDTRTTSVPLLQKLKVFQILICCFHCWLWTSKCQMGKEIIFWGLKNPIFLCDSNHDNVTWWITYNLLRQREIHRGKL